MLKYLIIPLSTDATSFCHYSADGHKPRTRIDENLLKAAIRWGMMENLSIQFIYPDETIPDNIAGIVESIDHTKIVPSGYAEKETLAEAQVVVFNSWDALPGFALRAGQVYIIRTSFSELLQSAHILKEVINAADRINIVVTDIARISEGDITKYGEFLDSLIPSLVEEYKAGRIVQLNILTDRAMISAMNNCNAGVEAITLSPSGKFFICPAFAADDANSCGSLKDGLNIPNGQLYDIKRAPICGICDAYHCKRCVWLNKQTTHEVNTPGRVQCLLAHAERNASRKFLDELHAVCPEILTDITIKEISYMDPFDKLIKGQ